MSDDNLAAFGNATATAALVDAATGYEYGRVETDGTTCTVYAPDDSTMRTDLHYWQTSERLSTMQSWRF